MWLAGRMSSAHATILRSCSVSIHILYHILSPGWLVQNLCLLIM